MKEISSDKLEELVNRKTGKDFHWFFEQYLHNRFTPELEYCVKDKELYYRWNPNCSAENFNRMKVNCWMNYGEWIGNDTLVPSTMIKDKQLTGDPKIIFDDKNILFKAVENKKLAKEFRKQK